MTYKKCPYGTDCELYSTCTLKHCGGCIMSKKGAGNDHQYS